MFRLRCEVPARTIANTLRDICKKILIERSLAQSSSRLTEKLNIADKRYDRASSGPPREGFLKIISVGMKIGFYADFVLETGFHAGIGRNADGNNLYKPPPSTVLLHLSATKCSVLEGCSIRVT